MILSEVLRRWRIFREMSQKEAACMMGIDAAALGRFEKGETISAANLAKVITWLIREEDEKQEAPQAQVEQRGLLEDPETAE